MSKEIKRSKFNECYHCEHMREVPGNCHIKCVKPDAEMTGNPHGIKEGWFMYPLLFDPTWKTKMCNNYESNSAVSQAVSQPVSLDK